EGWVGVPAGTGGRDTVVGRPVVSIAGSWRGRAVGAGNLAATVRGAPVGDRAGRGIAILAADGRRVLAETARRYLARVGLPVLVGPERVLQPLLQRGQRRVLVFRLGSLPGGARSAGGRLVLRTRADHEAIGAGAGLVARDEVHRAVADEDARRRR